LQSGWISYYLGGNSIASPHVAGIVLLMLQKELGMTASEAETMLEAIAIWISAWSPEAAGAGLVIAGAALVV
jgi:subtilase family serine protease